MQEFIAHIIEHLAEPDRLPIAVIAILTSSIIGFLTGPLGNNTNPLIWALWHGLLSPIGKRLNRQTRSQGALFARGLGITALTLLISAFVGRGIIELTLYLPHYKALETLILCCFLSSGAVWKASLQKKTEDKNDPHTIARAKITKLTLALDKTLIAPVFLYFIAGLPLTCIYSALSFLLWRFGHDKPETTLSFAAPFIAIEKILGIIPHLIGSLCLTLASFISPGANPLRAIKSWFGIKGRAPYIEGGLILSITAWALNITLGGTHTDADGIKHKKTWTGPENSSAKVTESNVRRTIYLTITTHTLFLILLMIVYLGKQFY